MKEFNIIEAVKYLKNNYTADIHLKDKPHIKLKLDTYSKSYEVYICNSSMGVGKRKNWASFFLEKWILEEPEKSQRTHEEIMTNWFKDNEVDAWMKIVKYDPITKMYIFNNRYMLKDFFNDLEMSELPEE